uniref:Large ribosomal subunit protein uL14 n=1 Tax=Ailuropoda melanoleuca TaxID=9646 RepID=A0A7N5J9E7_AILME
MVMATVKKGEPELRKKVHSASYWRKDGVFLYFEDNVGVTVNNKGEMKGSAVTGSVAKEGADLWPRTASDAGSTAGFFSVFA